MTRDFRNLLIGVALATVCSVFCSVPAAINERITTGSGNHARLDKNFQPGNWNSCKEGEARSPAMTDTSSRVTELRKAMGESNVHAYIIPSGDFHLSEFVSAYDQRRAYISGFSGSAGVAVVTMEYAALWTDGRYFLQAEAELGCDWILMRESESGVPSIAKWLGSFLPQQHENTIAAHPGFFGNDEWQKLSKELQSENLELKPATQDFIDFIWTSDRPKFPSSTINPLAHKYTGMAWQKKIQEIRREMERQDADVLVITALDEIAWVLNMRGKDITGFVNDPFFYSLMLIQKSKNSPRLYLESHTKKLSAMTTDPEAQDNVMTHLNTAANGSCTGNLGLCVEVREYDFADFIRDVENATRQPDVKKVWLSYQCNYAIFDAVPNTKVFVANTPAAMMKTQKNTVEARGMQKANIRDAVALIQFMAKLEREVRKGKEWSELSAAKELTKYRRRQRYYRGDSFAAISSIGPNSAVNHYFVNEVTNRKITMDETYLLDSGGQYLDGTTDVTRTFMFSRKPSAYIKECYTRVLMGQINLALAVWNQGKYGRELDAFARKPLWDVGLIYRHGTGHGIGAYLSVHEGPARISNYHALFPWDVPLDEGMFFSDEPGYYEEDHFGIRLENIVHVVPVETEYTFPGSKMLGFETITLVPYEPYMIDYTMLDDKQIAWLNMYNKATLKTIGPLLKEEEDTQAYNWLKRRTGRVSNQRSGATRVSLSPVFLLLVCVLTCLHGLF